MENLEALKLELGRREITVEKLRHEVLTLQEKRDTLQHMVGAIICYNC